MDALLHGLAPACPTSCAVTIRDRADGIPLYAVETVRMLLDRGLVEPDGDGFRVSGPVEALEVPETLHALIAARLDGLEPDGARVLEDAAVLGKTFTQSGLVAVSGSARGGGRADPRLAGAEGAARAPDRPALARTGPVRLPPGARPARRLRHACPPRSQGSTSRGRRLLEREAGLDPTRSPR